MRLNWGVGPHYAEGFWNIDVTDNVRCDQVVSRTDPFAGFADGSIDAIYAGHVLEHIPWAELPGQLREARRVLAPGGEMMIVGPDVYLTIERYRRGEEPWSIVEAVLESDHNYQQRGEDWDGACHAWNYEAGRTVRLLEWCGFTAQVWPLEPGTLAGWPVVSFAQWQSAVRAVRPPG